MVQAPINKAPSFMLIFTYPDHIYCSPSWSQRDGTPYSIARIVAFLGPENAPSGNGDEIYHYTRVRLAWYYRPIDVSDRPSGDSRLLLATIFSEVLPINTLRGKCYVLHRDKIPDLSSYKKRPDRFYFCRLFDPYIKKEFEVIQSSDVHNCAFGGWLPSCGRGVGKPFI